MGLFGQKKAKVQPEPITLADVDFELAAKLDAQDQQMAAIQRAEGAFKDTGDIDALIAFWEDIWDNGGLLVNGSRWTFRLPDLYIKIQDYDNTLRILRKIKNPAYKTKKESYIERVYALKAKQK